MGGEFSDNYVDKADAANAKAEPRVMAFDLGSEDYTVHTKSTIRDGQWVVVQMIRIRDGKSGWREIEVKETSK